MRVLRVKGTGRVSKSPDLIVFSFKIKSRFTSYDETIRDLNLRSSILKKDVVTAGFKAEDLKTTNFEVDTEYQYKDGKHIFIGYEAEQDLRLEFPFNKEDLNELIRVMSVSKANAEFKIYFEIKDKEAFKSEILAASVKNAKQNATVIAQSASVKLGKILNIIYDWQEIVYRSEVVMSDMAVMSDATFDIEPEDVKGSDSLSIEWEIEDII